MSGWRFVTEPVPWQDGVNLHIGRDRSDGGMDVVHTLTLTAIAPNESAIGVGPALSGREADEFLRAALNAAWERGLRPDGFSDTRESMAATKAHLEDMRSLTTKLVDAAIDAPRPLAVDGTEGAR